MPTADDDPPIAATRDLPETWQVDGEDVLSGGGGEPVNVDLLARQPGANAPRSPKPKQSDPPPPVDEIVEAMLFVGGPPLTAEHARAAVRGLTADRLLESVDALNRKYRAQGRPYAVRPSGDGFTLAVKPAFRAVREKLFGGPREARLSQPALDVLALVAYRQPVAKGEIDSVRGADSGSVLRQLVRFGLIAVVRRGDAGRRDVAYGTTPRFLDLFGLASPDDLPRLGDTQPL
jgi:segregation and condensation protein B